MSGRTRIFIALLPLLLVACAPNRPAGDTYQPAATLTPASAATLVVGHLDTGFLYFGNTQIMLLAVDGKKLAGGQLVHVTLSPGEHEVVVRAFRDPVAAYACIPFTFEAGKTYVAETTKPYMETTTMWLSDKATGAAVSQKVKAEMIRDPVMWGPGLKALFVKAAPTGC
jgi:hypothetical protein